MISAVALVRRGPLPAPLLTHAPQAIPTAAPPLPVPGESTEGAPSPGRTALPQGGRLEVFVKDDRGRSAGGTALCLRSGRGDLVFKTTDERGRAVFDLAGPETPGEGEIFAGRFDVGGKLWWARQSLHDVTGFPPTVTITYNALSEIEGMVVRPDERRVLGAQVRVWFGPRFAPGDPAANIFGRLTGKSGEWEILVTTDPTGVFRIEHVPAELGLRFELVSEREDRFLSVSTDLRQESSENGADSFYRAPSPAHYSVVLTRQPGADLEVSALTWDGLPAAQALVSLRLERVRLDGNLGPRRVLKVDTYGRGKVPLVPLIEERLVRGVPGPRFWAAGWKKGLGLTYATGRIDPAHPEIQVRFPKSPSGPTLEGRVVDGASQTLLRGAEVRITSTIFEQALLADLRTDAKGRYRLEGLGAPDVAWSSTLERGFHFFAEAGAGNVQAQESSPTGGPQEVHPGGAPEILYLRKP